MKETAKHLAGRGRNGDTMLVHMSPEEVRGLQYLALASGGGPLTVNPDTGLVEAFKLGKLFKSFLPMIAGGLLAATGIGAPLAAAMVAGGSTILNKGNWKKGLMDGLSAFGGAGVGQALAGAGKQAATAAAAEAAKGAAGSGITAGQAAALNLPASAAGEVAKTAATDAAKSQLVGQTMKETGKAALGTGKGLFGMPTSASNFSQGLGYMKQGLQAGTSGLANAGQLASGIGYSTGMAAASKPMAKMSEIEPIEPMKEGPTYYYQTRFNQGQVNPNFGQPGETYFTPRQSYDPGQYVKRLPGMPEEPVKRAGGGIAGYAGGSYEPKIDPMNDTEVFAAGGKLLSGPGDGVSDGIPARIYGRGGQTQEARLADGEYVLDARTVSELGNGSTAAGARRLREMVQRVHASRKKAGVGADSKAAKYLPA